MLGVYLVSLAVGGLFVALSAFTGGDADADFDADVDADFDADVDADFDADADADFDADADADFDADADADFDADAGGGGGIDKSSLMVVDDSSEISRRGIWLPFLSFRFWTFTSAFFGLTGLLLTLISTASQLVIFPSSLALGLASGFGVAYTLHRLKRENVDSALKVKRLVGQEALVVLPIDADHKGKIRIEHGMGSVELLAATDEREPLERGDTVVVIRMEGDTAHVVRPSRLLG